MTRAGIGGRSGDGTMGGGGQTTTSMRGRRKGSHWRAPGLYARARSECRRWRCNGSPVARGPAAGGAWGGKGARQAGWARRRGRPGGQRHAIETALGEGSLQRGAGWWSKQGGVHPRLPVGGRSAGSELERSQWMCAPGRSASCGGVCDASRAQGSHPSTTKI